MNITRNNQFGIPILCARGTLLGSNFPIFVTAIKTVFQQNHPKIAIDLSGVTRMGRTEARQLLEARAMLAQNGCALSIVGLSPAAIEAFGQASRSHRSRSPRKK